MKRPQTSSERRVTSLGSSATTLALFFAAITSVVDSQPLVGEIFVSRQNYKPSREHSIEKLLELHLAHGLIFRIAIEDLLVSRVLV